MLWNRKLLLNEEGVVWVELYQLRYFVRAAKYENISMAAQELHVTQPSISKAIRALEKELNTELMRKSGKHCVLTYEGRIMQARLVPILDELNELCKDIQRGGRKKVIRLNVLSGELLVPELIRMFRQENPDVFFNVLERREEINWDVCIRSNLPQIFFGSAQKLMDEKILLAFHKDSWLKDRKVVSLEDIANENFIMLREGGSIRMISDQIFKRSGFIPNVAFECDNPNILKRMVREGLGITVWPQYSWQVSIREREDYPDVCFRPLDVPGFMRSLYLVYQKDIKMTPELKAFSEFTIGYFKSINKQ